jgi:hypothetical protein
MDRAEWKYYAGPALYCGVTRPFKSLVFRIAAMNDTRRCLSFDSETGRADLGPQGVVWLTGMERILILVYAQYLEFTPEETVDYLLWEIEVEDSFGK